MGIFPYLKRRRVRSWPTVQARGVHARLLSTGSYTAQLKNRLQRQTQRDYYPEITYAYEYGGKKYTKRNTKILTGRSTNSPTDAAVRILDRYPPGSEFRVYVNPADPSDSYPEVSTGIGGFVAIAMGVVFFVMGALA